jgi:hypothetical protein
LIPSAFASDIASEASLTISLKVNGTLILEFGSALDSEVVVISEEEASVLWRTKAASLGVDV